MKKKNNRILHIISTCFDEPIAMKFLKTFDTILSIHGCNSSKNIIHIGGLNTKLANLIKQSLLEKGFAIGQCENPEISGTDKDNICNKCKRKGVQMEISGSLRDKFKALGRDSRYYKKFISAIRKGIRNYVDTTH